MNLATVTKTVRLFMRAAREKNPLIDRDTWEAAGVAEATRLTEAHGLVPEVVARYWSGTVQTMASNIVQAPGSAPRANPDQTVLWADLAPLVGLSALRRYFKRTRRTHDRHELAGRILAAVSATFGSDEQRMAEYDSLAALSEAAGVEARDVEALREVVEPTGTEG